MPTAVEIDGREYSINSDYRNCLRAILAFEDDELVTQEKQFVMLRLLYPEMPENIEKATYQAIKFLNGGIIEENEESIPAAPRIYSFGKDANLIFAAFKQTHGIDLAEIEYLHWWKFMALFMDLGSDTAFCNLVGLRKRLKTGKATREERQAAIEIGDLFDIPDVDTRTLEEKEQEAEFLRMVYEK